MEVKLKDQVAALDLINVRTLILNDKTLDYLEEHLPELMATATKQAYWQTLASGQSVLIAEAGKLVEVFPDGTRKFIKDIAKPTTVVRQDTIRL